MHSYKLVYIKNASTKVDFFVLSSNVEECVNTKCVIFNSDQSHGMFIKFVANNHIVISFLYYPMISFKKRNKEMLTKSFFFTRNNDRFIAQLNTQISESLGLNYKSSLKYVGFPS